MNTKANAALVKSATIIRNLIISVDYDNTKLFSKLNNRETLKHFCYSVQYLNGINQDIYRNIRKGCTCSITEISQYKFKMEFTSNSLTIGCSTRNSVTTSGLSNFLTSVFNINCNTLHARIKLTDYSSFEVTVNNEYCMQLWKELSRKLSGETNEKQTKAESEKSPENMVHAPNSKNTIEIIDDLYDIDARIKELEKEKDKLLLSKAQIINSHINKLSKQLVSNVTWKTNIPIEEIISIISNSLQPKL